MSAKPAPEHVIGRYVLCGELASGGMATVHLGRMFGQAGFSRTVAIKRLHPQFAKDRDFAAMFVDEARLAARIQHPNVVSTLDVEALGDELVLVMEYVPGESLSRISRLLAAKGERFPLAVASSILTGALLGLHAAHEATAEDGAPLHIVHRDVSPQNIMVGADGTARVLDFGVAKAAVRAQVTRDGQIKGKIAYMAPEQLQQAPVDRRADVYGAAVVLWEMLTMRRLFDGDHDAAVLMQVMSATVPPPSALVPGLPPALDAIVLRGLARDPEHRFPTAHAMAVALEDAIAPASPRKVGEWLAQVASGALERRAQQVKEVESRRGAPPAEMPASVPPSSGISRALARSGAAPVEVASQISTIAVSSGAGMAPRARRPWAAIAAIVAAGAVVAVATGLWLLWPPAPAPGASGSASAPASPEPPASPSPSAPASAAAASAAPAESPAVSAATGGSPSASPVAAPTPKQSAGGKAPAGKATSTGKTPVSTGCNPPYTIDARGIRRMKPECL